MKNFHLGWHEPPRWPELFYPTVWTRRIRLMLEELSELATAYAFRDLTKFADGVIDLAWVVFGTGVEAGLPVNELWEEVKRANMDKFNPFMGLDANGKVLKPEGWKPPDIARILREASD